MYVGLDAGTSVVKAVALDANGATLAVAGRPTRTDSPAPGYQEQDLERLLDAVGATIREVSAAAGGVPEIIGLTAQGDGVWLLDDDGHAVRPPILWSDARASCLVARWQASGLADDLFRRTGNTLFPGTAAPILVHLRDHEPDALAQAATAAYCKDAVLQRLTGVRATEVSDASSPFLDIRHRRYDPALLQRFGLDRYAHLLAPVDPWPSPPRELSTEGAALTGLPHGTPVHAGPFDLVATMIGAGMKRTGDGLIILGTTLGCAVLVDRVRTDGEAAGMTICMPEPGRWARVMAAMVGTPVLEWALALVGAVPADLDPLLAASPPGANGATVLPLLSPAGERAPFLDPLARGQVGGLSLETSRADLVRAVCEGIGYASRHCLERAGLASDGEVSLCGGGTRSLRWRQVLADVVGRPLRLARQPEVGARGAVMAALTATGRPYDRAQWCAPEATVEPVPARRALYDAGYAHYRERLEATRGHWRGPTTAAGLPLTSE